MHMADALLSPTVGATMWAASVGVAAYSIKKVQADLDENKIPLMGVMGAFVFAAQMINFTIPATGSSGHIGGGILLAILLGPYAGFLTLASILTIQALFFADGGLLALGSNIFNLGFYTCFIAYPLIYKQFTRKSFSTMRILIGAMLAAIIGLQLGSLGVVLQTLFSGKSELPFQTFLILMQPIHLAIGIVEGLVTAVIVGFVWRERPEIIESAAKGERLVNKSVKKVLAGFTIAALLTGGILSWYASSYSDGLEWSIMKTSGKEGLSVSGGIHEKLASIQEKIAFLPDYSFKANEENHKYKVSDSMEETKTSVNTGASISGIVGGLMTLMFVVLTSVLLRILKKRNTRTA